MKSCIYEGRVRHRRFTPAENGFSYSLFMLYLDLAELPALFDRHWLWSARRFNLAWFRRADHMGDPAVPLATAVRDLVQAETGRRPAGPIRLLTHLRYFGYGFNPVSFYYCFDRQDQRVETIVAEVNNTPWGERHCYVLDERLNEGHGSNKRYRFDKRFHVSPFMEMALDYDWRFNTPADRLAVHMANWKNGARLFDATLTLERKAVGAPVLARTLATHPFMTGKVIAMIYWQALKLWWKRVPFHTHPTKPKHAEVKEP